MKLLILDSKSAHGLDFALRALRDGHDVIWFIPEDQKSINVGAGLVRVVRDFMPYLKWADIIFVTDNTTYLRNVDAARKEGYPIVGASSESADWELDRSIGMRVLEIHDIQVPAYREFTDYDDAIRYVKKQNRPFVSKPSGDADKALSYVAKTPADLVYMLERWKRNQTLKAPFILQEKIEGTEMAVGGWIGPEGFNSAFCENFEFKKLCTGNLGCSTGEQGTVLRYVKHSKLARKMLLPFEDELIRIGHTGYVDVNCIVNSNGQAWPLEFTVRPGWPTFQIQQALHQGDSVEWLVDLIEGKDAHNVTLDEIAVGVVMSIPDYPYSHITRKEVTGIPIYIKSNDLSNVHFCEVMACTAPDPETLKPVEIWGTAGDYVLITTGTGPTVMSAKAKAYQLLTKINCPNNPMWRVDIGDRLKKELPMLQAHGYATDMSFAKAPPAQEEKPKEDSMQIGGLKVIYV